MGSEHAERGELDAGGGLLGAACLSKQALVEEHQLGLGHRELAVGGRVAEALEQQPGMEQTTEQTELAAVGGEGACLLEEDVGVEMLGRDELKAACEALGLDSRGREKAGLAERLLASGPDGEEPTVTSTTTSSAPPPPNGHGEVALKSRLRRFVVEMAGVNGGLFTAPVTLPLGDAQLAALTKAAEANWKYVDPHIFGSVFQGIMNDAERHKSGAITPDPAVVLPFRGHGK